MPRTKRGRCSVASTGRASGAEGAVDKVFLALLDDSEPLGPGGEFLARLAGCPGGTEAVSEMSSRLTAYTARMASSEVAERAAALWRAASEARLPAGPSAEQATSPAPASSTRTPG
ncbi:hypothetical protein [Streptomyces shenzhenensis]|uniref:hypothetical protein n=1 Tax=Streptomyces shenzhenensis TaxID=943815 RepID=UPI0015F0C64F|nr:hypothetical protein [Streptomyces shenzhenensis]